MNSEQDQASLHKQRTSRRMEKRREQICEVAAVLFAKNGYQATTLEMIAEELGYSKTSLYHYVKSKDEVLALLAENLVEGLYERAVEVAPEHLPADERLRRVIRMHTEHTCTHPENRALHTAEPIITAQQVFEFPAVKEGRDRYRHFLKDLIRDGVDQGVFHVTNVRAACLTVLSAMNGVSRWYSPQGELNPQQISDCLAELLIGGLINPKKAQNPASQS